MKVGDKVYVVYDDNRRKPFYTTIRSIGRKYITINNAHPSESRFDILTKLSADDNRGWNCKAKLYESEEQFVEFTEKYELVKSLTSIAMNMLKAKMEYSSRHIRILNRIINALNEEDR